MIHGFATGGEFPSGPRAASWRAVEQALGEGKPKTALEALGGIESAAVRDKAWAEAARAIATRILAETGDRPPHDPERLILLAAAMDKAPPETRGVLEAIRANWTWGYFQMNRWRYQLRTQGGADAKDLAKLAEWDLPTIVREIRGRFAAAIGTPGSPGRAALQKLPVADWSALIQPGSMADAYRPTVWDVIVRDAIEFSSSGERGLVAPEDAFELDAAGPALGTPAEFSAWRPEAGATDGDSPLLETVRLYRDLLAFHEADDDRTAFLAADLDRIRWAGGAVVSTGEPEDVHDRREAALRGFIERAGQHETASLGRFFLASLIRQGDGQDDGSGDPGDLVEARTVALAGAEADPKSPGGAMCRNLVAEIESRDLSLQTESTWAAPWPVIRVTYRNLEQVHLRLVKADFSARLQSGMPRSGWSGMAEAERDAILALPPLRTRAVDLPATPDYRRRHHDVPATALDTAGLEPGHYWVIASHRADFGGEDNVVFMDLVQVTNLAIVADHDALASTGLAGHVVNVASGEPVAGATVRAFVRGEQGWPRPFAETATATADEDGRYELAVPPQKEVVVVATADLGGRRHTVATEPSHFWRHHEPAAVASITLVTDRGIHRPGQIVHYKGIACAGNFEKAEYQAMADREIVVTLRDANGREVAKAVHKTSANGSFHGTFPVATGALPGQWSIQAQATGPNGFAGGVGVRVEEYKRPKFLVRLAAPERTPPLGGEVTLSGTATTYTGLAVSGATVKWHVERLARWPLWCRWFHPWLPFDAGSRRIARGTAVTDHAGTFTVTFTAKPDRSVPKESQPVFTYSVVADVTDTSGETRSDTRSVSVGYTAVEASVSAAEWQATGEGGRPADVRLAVGTTTLDGQPREAAGTLTISRLVQEVTASLPAGIYKAVFEIAAAGDVPAVRAEQVIEVVDPAAARYGVKRAFMLAGEKLSAEPSSEFAAVVGTGYGEGRALVEIARGGKSLARYWTEPGRTQWPVRLKVTDAHRGGFTVRAWMVRDGRLHSESRTIDVPWTNKKLAIEWERFTRRLEPGAKEIWRARVRSVADPVAGQAAPVAAEFLALAYDQSLDALAAHAWPGGGLMGLFRHESNWLNLAFTNTADGFSYVLGTWDVPHVDVPDMTYRVLRDPFGAAGGGWGMMRGHRMMVGGKGMDAMAGAAAIAMAEAGKNRERAASGEGRDKALRKGNAEAAPQEPGGPPTAAATAPPPPRKNLVETAFFLPSLVADKAGVVTIEFTLPDTLTTWQFKGLAHDATLRSGVIVDECVSAKDLMVEPVVPRFLREGDVVQIPVKVSNTSAGRLSGTVRLALADARTDADRSGLVDGPRELPFDLAAGESKPVAFTLEVADGTETLRYLATGSAGRAADGEEALLVVLPRRVLVSESVPVTIRGPGERTVSLERLARSADPAAGTDIQSQSLVVQATSNPAWYAVLALPAIMEQADESTETLFTRLYANTLARHLATSDPRIGKVFEQWKGTAALESPLEKNTDVVKTLLAETPWLRDAVDEREARARIALLFDTTRADNEMQAALARLQGLRNGDGGWPWFPGGRTCDAVTLGILAGFGRLRAAGVTTAKPADNDLLQPALQTIPWLDGRLAEEKRRAESLWKDKPDDIVLTPIGVYALYARSFFREDAPPQGEAAESIRWALDVGRRCWMKLDSRLTQGQLAIALARSGDRPTALSIIDSLKQRAIDADVKPGAEKESWQGMWWRDPHPGWWSWAHAPIASQTVMIEAFDEVAGDRDAVEALKVWLLSQKRTSRWRGSRATADAVGALLGHGDDLLAPQKPVTVDVGGERLKPANVEAGTGFFEERFTRREIKPEMAAITVTKMDAGLAFGGVHWQYLDDIAKVPAAGREELSVEKRLFVKRMTKAGPELVPIAVAGAAVEAGDAAQAGVELGDELVVRLVVTSDRDHEFLELADHRPSIAEPVDVLSGWRWADGAAWYVAIRDASTQLFFERLPRGVHVFEYSLRAAHRGTASSGFARIQSRYAPEFNAHSASVAVEVR
ncbi:MAG: hypothetical protein EBZ59_03855 [Planctomycetia bacterium]|nr:hypothetical protein [Planctomycetia bacterium]